MDGRQADVLLQQAIEFHQQGRTAEAEALYNCLLQFFPGTPLLLHNLGAIALDDKRTKEAIDLLNQAIKAKPDYSEAYTNLGLALGEDGQDEEAVAAFKTAIRLTPQDARNHFFLGNIYQKKKQLGEAAQSHRCAVALQADYMDALAALAFVLAEDEQSDEAIEVCKKILMTNPSHVGAYIALGAAYRGKGDLEEAEKSYRDALDVDPDNRVALANLARVLNVRQRSEEAIEICDKILDGDSDDRLSIETKITALVQLKRWEEALPLVEKIIKEQSEEENILIIYGQILEEVGRWEEALDIYSRLAELKKDGGSKAEIWNAIGILYFKMGRNRDAVIALTKANKEEMDSPAVALNLGSNFLTLNMIKEAKICFRKALSMDPDARDAYSGLAQILFMEGDSIGAVREMDKAHELDSGKNYLPVLVYFRRRICDWDGLPEQEAAVVSEIEGGKVTLIPFAAMSLYTTAREQQLVGIRYAKGLFKYVPGPLPFPPERKKTRLRIGYLSGDICNHPVTRLMLDVMENHDHSRFEFFVYSYDVDRPSEEKERVREACDHFIDLWSFSHIDMVKRIREDEIDILVDLSGYTALARTAILAYRPAPIQVSYLGFPGTMGTEHIDYILGDEFLLPMRLQPYFCEKIVHLSGCYLSGDTKRKITPTTRKEQGIPEDAVLLVTFNNTNKITPELFSIWMKFLKANPKAILWVAAKEQETRDNLTREAAARGVSKEQLLFADGMMTDRYIGCLALGDLFLDSYPFNAGATANDVLWAGLPLLTLSGETYTSRMAGAMLTAIGLPELIATSFDEYEAKGLDIVTNPEKLAALKQKLAENRETYPLFDTKRFTRSLEDAYLRMWAVHEKGEKPRFLGIDG